MLFDKSRIYTAINADELKIGSKCIFADTIQDLRKKVEGGYLSGDVGAEDYWCRLVELYDDDCVNRFVPDSDVAYLYAYLIEPPVEPKYKPFKSVEEAMKAIKEHGGYLYHKGSRFCSLITSYDDNYMYSSVEQLSLQQLTDDYVFVDDDSPCGVPVEE